SKLHFGIAGAGPLRLGFEQEIMHFPVVSLLSRGFCGKSGLAGIRMDSQGVVAKLQAYLPVESLQHAIDDGIVRCARRTLVVAIFEQRYWSGRCASIARLADFTGRQRSGHSRFRDGGHEAADSEKGGSKGNGDDQNRLQYIEHWCSPCWNRVNR